MITEDSTIPPMHTELRTMVKHGKRIVDGGDVENYSIEYRRRSNQSKLDVFRNR